MKIAEEGIAGVTPIRIWPRLLTDAPADEDHLQSFGRMAEALFNMIRENAGGQTVCINGAWGTGKSTLVRMLANRFSTLDAHDSHAAGAARVAEIGDTRAPEKPAVQGRVFVYDAWVHAGDPLRRAFLSSLVDFLLDPSYPWLSDHTPVKKKGMLRGMLDAMRHWLGDDMKPGATEGEWTIFKHKIAGRYKTVERVPAYRFGPLGRLLAGAVLVSPIVALAWARLSSSMQDVLQSADMRWFEIGCLCIIAATFFVALRLPDQFVGALIKKDSLVVEKVDTTDEPVPSSLEFEQRFVEILDRALVDEQRRLIIVLDNLDRISQQERESVWTLLRSFIDNSNVARKTWFRNIWVIVPLAASKLTPQMQAAGDADPAGKPASHQNQDREKTPAQPDTVSETFFEKLFQITVDVPPPTLHRWEKYLSERLDDAFGGGADRFKTIVRLFGVTVSTQTAPTLRGIVRFVNSLVALHYQWPSVSLARLAAFVLAGGREGIESGLNEPGRWDVFEQIIHDDPDTASGVHAQARGDSTGAGELAAEFTQIYYGVESVESKGGHQLELAWLAALQKNDRDQAISLMHNDSAVNALNRALAHSMWTAAPVRMLNSFLLLIWLYEIDLAGEASFSRLRARANWRMVAQAVRKAMRRVTYAPLDEEHFVDGYQAYLKICGDSAAVAKDAFASLRRLGREDVARPFSKESAKRLASILSLPAFDALLLVEAERFMLPYARSDYLRFCAIARDIVCASPGLLDCRALERRGFGWWQPHNGWKLSGGDDLARALADRRTAESFPLAYRGASFGDLQHVFEWFVYAATTPTSTKYPGARIGFAYLVEQIGAVAAGVILRQEDSRRYIFNSMGPPGPGARRIKIDIFILILCTLGPRASSRGRFDEKSAAIYSDAIAGESMAHIYARAITRVGKRFHLPRVAALAWRAGEAPVSYWARVAKELRFEFAKRLPGLRKTGEPSAGADAAS